jgi:hypothetical protein
VANISNSMAITSGRLSIKLPSSISLEVPGRGLVDLPRVGEGEPSRLEKEAMRAAVEGDANGQT